MIFGMFLMLVKQLKQVKYIIILLCMLLDDVNVLKDIKLFEEDRLLHCYNIVEDLIVNKIPPKILSLIQQSYEKDLNKLLDNLIKETYRVLYGRTNNLKPNIKEVSELDVFLEEELQRQDLTYFAHTALSEFEVNWHHIEWGLLVQNYNFLAILAARDHGKSYFFSLAYPLWRAFRYNSKSKNLYDRLGRLGYLFSMTSSRSSELLEIVKEEVENNDYLREKLYPLNARDNWSKMTLRFKTGAKLRARGFGVSVRGAHPGYIINDDVLKDNVLYSETQRERNKDYFKAVIMNMLIPKGQLIVVGTPFHFKDLYSEFQFKSPQEEGDFDLMEKNNKWVFAKYPAIDKEGRILWPDRYNEKDLEDKRKQLGQVIFTREILVEPIVSDSSLFSLRLLQKSFVGMENYRLVGNIESFPIKFKRVITGCDFAKSAEIGADWTSFVTFGEDDFGNRYLLNMYHEKGVSFYDQITALKTIGKNFKPNLMLLEANQFQSIYSDVMMKETTLPIKPFITGRRKQDLYQGIPGLVLLFETNRIRLPRGDLYSIKQTDKIINEFNHIGYTDRGIQGIGEHDDIVMSIWLAMQGFDYNNDDFLVDFIG